MSIRDQLESLGLTTEQTRAVLLGSEALIEAEARAKACELLHRIFLRVDKDSVHGRALSRALGFTGDEPLSRAAKAFGVSKQYLHRVQEESRRKLGDLAAAVRVDAEDSKNSRVLPGDSPVTGVKSSDGF